MSIEVIPGQVSVKYLWPLSSATIALANVREVTLKWGYLYYGRWPDFSHVKIDSARFLLEDGSERKLAMGWFSWQTSERLRELLRDSLGDKVIDMGHLPSQHL